MPRGCRALAEAEHPLLLRGTAPTPLPAAPAAAVAWPLPSVPGTAAPQAAPGQGQTGGTGGCWWHRGQEGSNTGRCPRGCHEQLGAGGGAAGGISPGLRGFRKGLVWGEMKAWGAAPGWERGFWGRSSKVMKMGYFAHLCGSEMPEELVPDPGAPPQLGTRHRPHCPHPALAHPERGQPARGARRRGPFPNPLGDRPAPALPAVPAVSRHADSTPLGDAAPLGFFRSFAWLPYCPTLCWLGTGTLRGLPLLGP